MVNGKELSLIVLTVLFVAWWYLSCNRGRCLRQLKTVLGAITNLMVKIINLIQIIWFELKRSNISFLQFVINLAMIAEARLPSGGANIWIANWLAGISTFSFLGYCYMLCTQRKRAQLTRTWMTNKKNWFTILKRVLEFILILACLLLAFAYYRGLNPHNHHLGNNWKAVASIMKKIINIISVLLPLVGACEVLIKIIEPNQFRRNEAAFLEFVFTLAITAEAKLSSGGAKIWNVYFLLCIATIALLGYCYYLFVQIKRAQLTRTWMNNNKDWFLIVTRVLEFILFLACLLLAFAYIRELDPQNHFTGNDKKRVASIMKKIIDITSVLLQIIGACEILFRIIEQDEVPQLQTENNISHYLGETMLAVVPQRDVEDQSPADAHVAEVVHMDKEKKYVADAYVVVAVQRDVGSQSAADADPPGVAVQIEDVENQSDADASRPEGALQMDAEKQFVVEADPPGVAVQISASVADADRPGVAVQINDVENQSDADANRQEVAIQMDAEKESIADADPPGEAIQINDVDYQSDADPPGVAIHINDVEYQSDADANRPEMAMQMDAGKESVADAHPPGVAVQIDNVGNHSYALQMDVENKFVAYAIVGTDL